MKFVIVLGLCALAICTQEKAEISDGQVVNWPSADNVRLNVPSTAGLPSGAAAALPVLERFSIECTI